MRRLTTRVAAALERHPRLVLAAWLALLAAAVPFALRQDEGLTTGGYVVPGSGSAAVEEAAERIPGASPNRLAVVLRLERGADVPAAIERVERAAAGVEAVSVPASAASVAGREAVRSPVVVVPLAAPASQDDAIDAAVELRDRLRVGERARDGATAYLVGAPALWAAVQHQAQEDLVAAEAFGLPIVFLILLVTFGSLAAAALPLALGVVSVTLTGAAIHLLSRTLEMSVFVTNIASLIGIGVAVDYSLFVLVRYREELRRGAPPAEARRIALRTSGVAVAVAGATVILALGALFVVDSTMLRSLALGAIVVVALAVLGAVTLLPALLGRRAGRSRRLRLATGGGGGFWRRWTAAVMGRPVLALVCSAAVLLVFAVPALRLETGVGALAQLDRGSDDRAGTELAARTLGPGELGPVELLVRPRGDATELAAAARAARAEIARDPAVARVDGPLLASDGSAALLAVVPRAAPEDGATHALVDRLRGDPPPALAALDVAVGGATAQDEDFRELVADAIPTVLALTMALSFVVLVVLLRSLWLPLKAVVLNALTVGAAYGAMVVVFQWGWLDGLLGYDSLGYVNDITPAFVLPVVFGLSMDYEVFLLARIRERYLAHGDNRRAVAEALEASAGTITSAAAIMVAVFLTFAAVAVPSVKEVGVGLAVAIALDATLVRLVLVPASMELMGRWNWWLPRPLARVLPARAEA
jgi:uncharacterized membrane protein YdfJ with MMPL/SSD domain